jgi:hypothetical protein
MNVRRALGDSLSQPDPFHLILSETLFRAVVKLSCARALVRRHFLRMLEGFSASFPFAGRIGRGNYMLRTA